MKTFKKSLHFLLTFASMLGFLGGWAALAHSRKPVQTTSGTQTQAIEPLPTLQPIPAMGSQASSANNNNGLLNIITPAQPSRARRPVFTTSGS